MSCIDTKAATMTLTDARRLYGSTPAGAILEQQIGMADPTDTRKLDELAAQLSRIGMTSPTRNTVLQLQFAILEQRQTALLGALGRQGPISPARSDLSERNRGGVLDTATGSPLKAMASSGDLKKIIDATEPVMRPDGRGIDEAATAVRITMRAGALPGRLSPDGRRFK